MTGSNHPNHYYCCSLFLHSDVREKLSTTELSATAARNKSLILHGDGGGQYGQKLSKETAELSAIAARNNSLFLHSAEEKELSAAASWKSSLFLHGGIVLVWIFQLLD